MVGVTRDSYRSACVWVMALALIALLVGTVSGLAGTEAENAQAFEILIENLAAAGDETHLAAKDSLVALGRDAVDGLVKALQSHESDRVRYYAAWALGEIGGDAARDALYVAAQADTAVEVRESAVVAAARIEFAELSAIGQSAEGTRSSRKEAMELAERGPGSDIQRMLIKSDVALTRERCGRLLLGVSRKSTLRFLKTQFKEVNDPSVRRNICAGLGMFGKVEDKQLVSLMLRAAKDTDTAVRCEAVRQLGLLARVGDKRYVRIGARQLGSGGTRVSFTTYDERLVRAVARLLKDDADAEVRAVAASQSGGVAEVILRHLRDLPEWSSLKSRSSAYGAGYKEAREFYEKCVGEAVTANLKLVKRVVSSYEAVLRREDVVSVRREIGAQLGRIIAAISDLEYSTSICNEKPHRRTVRRLQDDVYALLLTLLKEEKDVATRIEIIPRLKHLDERKAARALLVVLKESSDRELRAQCVEVLGEIGGTRVERELVQAMVDSRTDDQLREKIVEVLGKLRAKSAVHELIVLALGDGSPSLRKAAIKALGDAGSTVAEPALLSLSKDPDASLRRAAIVSLASIRGRDFVRNLIIILKTDEDALVRERAVELLGNFESKAALPVVRGALDDTDARVREAALEVVATMRDLACLADAMKILTQDPDPVVRIAAVATVQVVGRVDAVPVLITALSDTSSAVRSAAAQALGEIHDPYCKALGELFLVWRTDEDSEVRSSAWNAIETLRAWWLAACVRSPRTCACEREYTGLVGELRAQERRDRR